MGKFRQAHVAGLLLIGLAGCGSQVLVQGEPNFNSAILLPGYDANNPKAMSSRNVDTLGLTPKQLPLSCVTADEATPGVTITQTASAETPTAKICVYEVKSLIDDQYREYRITLHHYVDDGNAALDIGSLGLSTAGTLIGAAAVKTTLSAFGTLLTGTRSVINQDVLLKAAIESVINQMDADRDKQFGVMIAEMSATEDYTVAQAKNDLLLYFSAGTWDHALVSMQTQTAANSANCKAATDNAKVQAAQGAIPASPSTATGCQGSSAPIPIPVGLGKGTITSTVQQPGGSVSVVLTAVTDDAVVITLPALKASQIAGVTINGAAQPKASTATLTAASIVNGNATVVFSVANLKAPTTFDVVATGRKGAQATGPETLATVKVTQ